MKNIYIKVKESSSGGGSGTSATWTRPSDWLALPTLVEGDQKVVGLHAVYGDSDFVSILCAGNYTVNWGDGTIQSIAANTKCDHKFDYSALAGTDCSRGYRQAIVTITPQAGQQLTKVDFQQKKSQANLSTYSGQWLDVAMVGSAVSTLTIGGTVLRQAMLEQFSFLGINIVTSFYYAFGMCSSLQSIPYLNTSNGTTFYYMYAYCYSLKIPPLIDTSKGVNFSGMHAYCTSMQVLPAYATPLGSDFSNMCSYCYALQWFPLLNTSKATTMANMFYSCIALQVISQLNTSLVQDYTNTIASCSSLQKAVFTGTKTTISYQNCKLSAAQLEAIFQALAAVSAQTITITGNWGTQYLTATQKAIATNKGWTLVL